MLDGLIENRHVLLFLRCGVYRPQALVEVHEYLHLQDVRLVHVWVELVHCLLELGVRVIATVCRLACELHDLGHAIHVGTVRRAEDAFAHEGADLVVVVRRAGRFQGNLDVLREFILREVENLGELRDDVLHCLG